MKILIDMNLSPRWVAALSDAGVSSSHWSSLGAADATDGELLAYARAGDWVILTQDLDFGAILATTNGEKPSVIQLRAEDVSPEVAAPMVTTAIDRMALELENGALVSVDPIRSRVRYLPFSSRP